jgi:hypothetical protein
LAIKDSEIEFYSEYASENENQEFSMWSIFFKMVGFLSSPFVFTDKAGLVGVFSLSTPDYDLPKLEMGGNSFANSHEIF